MGRYPVAGAVSTAAAVCAGGVWKTPKPRAGISTPLFRVMVGTSWLDIVEPFGVVVERSGLRPPSAGVFGVVDVLAPFGLRTGLAVREAVPDGEGGHEVVGGGSVPVPPPGRAPDPVPGVRLHDVPASGLGAVHAFGDVEGLPVGVPVPRGPGTAREVHRVDLAAGLGARRDDVEVHAAG